MSKNGIILNKLSSGKNSDTVNLNRTEESHIAYKNNDGFKFEETKHLNADVSALKAFILEHI